MVPGTGEWDTTGGDFNTVADAAAVPQGIEIRTKTILTEVYADESLGVDYLNVVLGKSDPLVVRAALQVPISDTPDVTNVVGAALVEDPATREASIAYSVDTVYSENTIAGANGIPPGAQQ